MNYKKINRINSYDTEIIIDNAHTILISYFETLNVNRSYKWAASLYSDSQYIFTITKICYPYNNILKHILKNLLIIITKSPNMNKLIYNLYKVPNFKENDSNIIILHFINMGCILEEL